MLLLALYLITMAVILPAASPLAAQSGTRRQIVRPEINVGSVQTDTWYFTAAEMEAAYKYQEYFGRRFADPLAPGPCLFGRQDFAASYRGKPFVAPCRFVNETVRHLKEIIQSGAGRYFFPLDIGHVDLAVPVDVWETNYSNRPQDEILPSLLRETTLVSLYRPGPHLKPAGTSKLMTKALKGRPGVLAFYDGAPAAVVDFSANSSLYGQYRTSAAVYFLAHRFGEILFTIGRRPVMLDMSFDDQIAGE